MCTTTKFFNKHFEFIPCTQLLFRNKDTSGVLHGVFLNNRNIILEIVQKIVFPIVPYPSSPEYSTLLVNRFTGGYKVFSFAFGVSNNTETFIRQRGCYQYNVNSYMKAFFFFSEMRKMKFFLVNIFRESRTISLVVWFLCRLCVLSGLGIKVNMSPYEYMGILIYSTQLPFDFRFIATLTMFLEMLLYKCLEEKWE